MEIDIMKRLYHCDLHLMVQWYCEQYFMIFIIRKMKSLYLCYLIKYLKIIITDM